MDTNKKISEYFLERKELLEFGKKIVQEVYDKSINEYYNAYDRKRNLTSIKDIEIFIETLNQEQFDKLKTITKGIVFDTVYNILYLTEFNPEIRYIFQKNWGNVEIDINKLTNGEIVDLHEISDGFMGDLIGEGGWLDLFSKYGDTEFYS